MSDNQYKLEKPNNLSEEIYNSLDKNLFNQKPINNQILETSVKLFNKTFEEKIQIDSTIMKNSALKSLYKLIKLDIHRNIKCENCNQKPIIGIRYKCLECPDYNLCNNCMILNDEKSFHPHDSFVKIRKEIVHNEKYSYLCENHNLTFFFKKYPEMNNIYIDDIYIKNDGKEQWPKETKFKYDKIKSTIKCNDVDLFDLKVNHTKIIRFEFDNINFVPPGEYECYLNFYCQGKIYDNPLKLKIILNE